ncbi:glycosyltransferase [Cupriavidus necator]|uniref:glycosyltransferase n=1 Tax=Cupriavidus necator TaxID=106590 RepID=UPI00339D46DB
MAHQQQIDFCESVKRDLPQFFSGCFVVDIGSLDINGNNQYLFDDCMYLGVDLMPGRNVDIASKGHELNLPDESVDVVVSTECFEHDQYYAQTLSNIVRMLKPGGLFFFSCATTGRPEHGTRRTKPEDAPFTQEFGDWGDYYKNLDESDIRQVLDVDGIFDRYAFSYNFDTCDIYFWGIKKGVLEKRDNYSFQVKRNTLLQELATERALVASLRSEAAEREVQLDTFQGELQQQSEEVARQRALLSQRSVQLSVLEERATELQAVIWERDQQIHEIYTSSSWRITTPLRVFGRVMRKKNTNAVTGKQASDARASRARLRALARTIYHRLPLSEKTKWRIRERLFPAVVALREADDLKGVTQGVVKAILGRPEGTLVRDDGREAALASILRVLGNHATQFGPVTRWIALPFLATGGAEMVALNFCRALRELRPAESVAILVTDRKYVNEQVVLPDGVVLIVFDDHLQEDGSYARKQALLRDLLLSVRPKSFHNINSEVAWHLILSEGERIKRFVRLYASIFAFQFAPDGKTKIGYAAYFLPKGLPHLSGLVSDNRRFVVDAAAEYGIKGDALERLWTVYQPCRLLHRMSGASLGRQRLAAQRARIERGNGGGGDRPQVLWAGRLDAEKRLDLFLDLVKACEFADFRVFGQIVLQDGQELPTLPNLSYEGPFSSPLEWVERFDFDAFIFTSKWEGMPNVLIEVGSLGIPIIAPGVGGVGELISKETGYLLAERPTVEDYKRALNGALSDRTDALNRATRLLDVIESRHTWPNFVEAVQLLPGYLDHSESADTRLPELASGQNRPDGVRAPRVSIIVPCYNQAKYLVEAVASIAVACAEHSFEIIVVDDGSTDGNTARLLAEAEQTIPGRIKVHRQSNKGLSGARNAGVALASGEFIQFLDADDVLAPGKIDVQLAQIAANPAIDISVCNFLLCDETKTDFSKPDEAIAQFDISLNDFLFRWERGFSIPIHCGLFRRTVIGAAPFDTEARAKEDWLFWTRLALEGARFAYVHGHWATYRQHGASMRRSYLKMGKAWLQAGLKIEARLQGREPKFFDSMVAWFDHCYRANPAYKAEVELLGGQHSGESQHLVSTPAQESTARPADTEAIAKKADRIVAILQPVVGGSDSPLISVVVPIYGHYNYLEGCLNSIANQGNVSLEIICVDDASPDPRVAALMDALKDRLSGLRVIQQTTNQGISEVQNIAVEAARGEFIAFLDCDDELAPNALEVIGREMALNDDVDYFFTDRIDIDESGKTVRTSRYGGYEWIHFRSQETIRDDLLDGMVASHLKVIRRSAYIAVGGCNSTFSGVQDWDLALRIAEHYRFRYIPQTLYKHRVHSASVTRSDLVAQFRKTNVLRREFSERWMKNGQSDSQRGNSVQRIIPINDAAISVATLKKHWVEGASCVADLRGGLRVPAVNFVREFNSYFDDIIWDDPSVAAALTGYLWSPRILGSSFAHAKSLTLNCK